VTKNPCLYPGDFRKLEAVDNIPVLTHCMRDCIVFPTVGPRPHSDEISGSDLDGDQYWVYWGTDLKIRKPVEPLAHSSAEKLIVSMISNEMVIDYFLNSIESNCYSLIADVHTVAADRTKGGTHSTTCVELAILFYRAIDSPKTGETINMVRVYELKNEFCKSFPKFMMRFDQSYYESTSII
jgi:RNA-dependent RNA polymerase